MGVALCLRFDEQTTTLITGVWRALAAAGVSSDMLQLGYPPHLTLFLTNDDLQIGDIAPSLSRLADAAPLSLILGAARSFPDTQVVYLACEGDLTSLQQFHRLALADLPREAIHEHYRDGEWTPHVTLQTRGDVGRSLAVVGAGWQGQVTAIPVALDLVTFPPIVSRASVDLERARSR